MALIDSHAHLTFPELRDQVDEILGRAAEAGVERIITVGINVEDARNAIALTRSYPAQIHASVGFHPHEAEKVTDADLEAMSELWDHSAVVALGEMGLDYHYDFADRAVQRSVFARQLEWAATRSSPIVIHCRAAFDDVISMLLDHGFRDRRVVFHCFTGSAGEALRVQECGWRISFTGIVTFPKSVELQAIARSYPRNALMIETDAPYLSPAPVRNKRPNEPGHVAHIARFLADLRNVPYEELVEQIGCNTMEFFNLPANTPSQ